MSITFSSDPIYPAPGLPVKLIATGAAGRTQRFKIVSAPSGSTFYRVDGTEVLIPAIFSEPERVGQETTIFTPDIAGEYTIACEDLDVLDGGRTSSFQDSPISTLKESILERATFSFFVMNKVSRKVGFTDSCTFTYYVHDSNVRQTTVAEYGETIGNTPRLEGPSTFKAYAAMMDPAVRTALLAQINRDVSSDDDFLQGEIDNLLIRIGNHFGAGYPVHNTPDTYAIDRIQDLYQAASSMQVRCEVINTLKQILTSHYNNEVSDGTFTSDVHLSVTPQPDTLNTINAPTCNVSQPQTLITLLADINRAHSGHRLQLLSPFSHNLVDGYAVLSPPALMSVDVAFIAVTNSVTFSSISGINNGALVLFKTQGVEPDYPRNAVVY